MQVFRFTRGVKIVMTIPAQYDALNKVIDVLLSTYPNLSKQRITGHSDIAPNRKTDPGDSFDWAKIIEVVV